MTAIQRGRGPAWRVSEGIARWVAPCLLGAILVAALLGEVWQSSRVAQLSLRNDRVRVAVDAARARLEFLRADLDHCTTRAQLAPVALDLGLRPADAQQVVLLPAAYLAHEETRERGAAPGSVAALAERVARALVPDAWARGRSGR
jgi:hypothetical protein